MGPDPLRRPGPRSRAGQRSSTVDIVSTSKPLTAREASARSAVDDGFRATERRPAEHRRQANPSTSVAASNVRQPSRAALNKYSARPAPPRECRNSRPYVPIGPLERRPDRSPLPNPPRLRYNRYPSRSGQDVEDPESFEPVNPTSSARLRRSRAQALLVSRPTASARIRQRQWRADTLWPNRLVSTFSDALARRTVVIRRSGDVVRVTTTKGEVPCSNIVAIRWKPC